MEQTITQQQRRSRAMLLMLACVFFGPFLIATIVFKTGLYPQGRTNRGALVEPPVLLQEATLERADPGGGQLSLPDDFKGKWSMVYIAPAECKATCRRDLHDMKQTWILLNRDITRVRRIWITSTPAKRELVNKALADQPHLWVADASKNRDVLAQFPVGELNASEAKPERVYLVDPGGFLAFAYLPGQNPKDWLKDLRKVLKNTRTE